MKQMQYSEKNSMENVEACSRNLRDQQQVKRRPSILTMKNEWIVPPTNEIRENFLQMYTEQITAFINSLKVPSWYRGLSDFQLEAGNNLLNAIHDDCAQRTVYRTLRCLQILGLCPLPTKKQLRKILPLCLGSDLALLWFLMDWLYRKDDSESYSVNEQLILSTIANLDLNSTLLELDRILPPKKEYTPEMRQERKDERAQNNSKKQLNKVVLLPYLKKLPKRKRIKLKYDINAEVVLKPIKMQFEPKENNCSFQSVIFDNDRTGAHNFTKERIDKYMQDFESANFAGKNEHTRIKQSKAIAYLRHSFDAKLNAIVKKKSQDLEQVFKRKKKTYKRILNRFQNHVEKFRHEFYIETESCQKLLNGSINSRKISKDVSSNIEKCCENASPFDSWFKPSENSSDSNFFSIPENQQLPFKFDYFKIFTWEKENSKNFNIPSEFLNKYQMQTPITTSSSSVVSNEADSSIHEIFQQTLMELEVINFINNTTASKINNSATTTTATTTTTTSTSTTTTTTKGKANKNVVDYGLNYYDPEDDELMDRMLEDAIKIMRKNPRFVCASMPACHRLPILREWIRLKYGKKFSNIDFSICFRKVKPILKALANIGLPVKSPNDIDLGTTMKIDYSCHDYVLKQSLNMREDFYKRIDNTLLAQSRVFFLALRPFLFCKTNPKFSNTIFAYMPARRRQTYHFRPWTP